MEIEISRGGRFQAVHVLLRSLAGSRDSDTSTGGWRAYGVGRTLADLTPRPERPHFSNFGPPAERRPPCKKVFGLGEKAWFSRFGRPRVAGRYQGYSGVALGAQGAREAPRAALASVVLAPLAVAGLDAECFHVEYSFAPHWSMRGKQRSSASSMKWAAAALPFGTSNSICGRAAASARCLRFTSTAGMRRSQGTSSVGWRRKSRSTTCTAKEE
eukprot:scaffold29380_cov70-Phaeocystis_antarctica.AAC.5